MQALEQSLNMGLLCPVYLFYGEDLFRMEQMVTRLCDMVAPGDSPWNKDVFYAGDTSFSEVLASAESCAFFAQKKLVLCRDVDWFRSKRKRNAGEVNAEAGHAAEVDALVDYCKDPNPDTVLLLLAPGSVPKNSRALKAVMAAGRAVEFTYLKGSARTLWLKRYLAESGARAEESALEYVAMMSGESTAALKSEADKLVLYANGAMIKLAHAEAVVSRGVMAGVFDLTDNIAAQNATKSIRVLRELLRQGEAGQMLLASLGSHFHNLLAVKDMTARGYSPADAAAKLGIAPYVAKKCAAQSRRFQLPQLIKALDILLAVDIDTKTGKAELNDRLELAVLRICAL